MTSDMMIICKEDNSGYDGNTALAFFIDECSMGDPLHEFGSWFQSRFCGAPGVLEQLSGIKEHNFTLVTNADFEAVKVALEEMKCHRKLDKATLRCYIQEHISKHISTESW